VNRIKLGNSVFEGLNNAYLLSVDDGDRTTTDRDGDGPVTLVDTGIATADVRADLEDGLANAGVAVGDVEQVLLSHWHEDHAGLAGWIQGKSGATVRAHAADAPLIGGDAGAREEMQARQRELFDEWGMPDGPREELLEFMSSFDDARGDPADVTPFESGERFRAGEREIEALHLPGHAAGLSGFVVGADGNGPNTDGTDSEGTGRTDGGGTGWENREDRGGGLFSGDALLPRYTPNVGGADVRVDRPLGKYLQTLTRIAERDFSVAWPGHRDRIADPSGRAREIAVHHRERTERVVEIIREHGPTDAWTVSAHLFGDLSAIHILHGPGEAYAHLDHLTGNAVEAVHEGESGGAIEYRLTERDPNLDSLFPGVALADT
jgi:hydroxyacylglutathione hydrolase